MSSKQPGIKENWRASGRDGGDVRRKDRPSDPGPAERPFEAALAAQTTDDTRRDATIDTLRRARERVSAPPEKKREGKNVPNVQRQKSRKESVAADFDLVTVAAYSNFSTSQPQPDFQDCESRHSQNFHLENFFTFSLDEHIIHWAETLKFTFPSR